MTTPLLTMLLALVPLSFVFQSSIPSELTQDRVHRDAAIHWPKEYDPGVAPVFSHNEFLIHSDCHRAFTRMADAPAWPSWFVLTKDVVNETPGPVGRGTLFRLKIFDTPIHAHIVEFVADQRISWVPYGADESETHHGHFHTWHFVPEGGGCRVVTEETGIGPNDIKDPVFASHFMHKAHDLWLASLKWSSEP